VVFENESIAIQAGQAAANMLKAGSRLVLASQTPAGILNSAGGDSFRANIANVLVGKVLSQDITSYTSPNLLNLPKHLITPNTSFQLPTKELGYSQWLLKCQTSTAHAKVYIPRRLVAIAANNIEEVHLRKQQQALLEKELQHV
jgi:hypothetical protein